MLAKVRCPASVKHCLDGIGVIKIRIHEISCPSLGFALNIGLNLRYFGINDKYFIFIIPKRGIIAKYIAYLRKITS